MARLGILNPLPPGYAAGDTAPRAVARLSPMSTREYDLIVLGAGPVGENVADRAVQGGLSAVVVEAELVGGECSYWACMPSKALLRPAAALAEARAVAGSAQAATGDLDVAAMFKRRTSFTHDWDDKSQADWLATAKIDLVRGTGRIVGERLVEVTGADGEVTRLSARHAVALCTGTSAFVPPVPGLSDADPWTSREATSATSVPESLIVLGGGVVGAEMATLYSALGSRVTVVARSGMLPQLEPFAGQAVEASLTARGASVVWAGVSAAGLAGAGETGPTKFVELDNGERVEAQEILVATGRAPRTEGLGLDALGLEGVRDGGWLPVDETLRVVGSEWLYAVGDVNHRALLTHQGKYQARAAGDVIAARALGQPVFDDAWGAHAATADHAAVPATVFTDPPIASVGPTAKQAEAAGHQVRAIDYNLGWVAGAATFADGYQGTARVVIDTERDVLLGATFVGPGVEEMVQAATIAVVGEVPIDRLWHAVPAYPTISEVWLRWLEEYGRPGAR